MLKNLSELKWFLQDEESICIEELMNAPELEYTYFY